MYTNNINKKQIEMISMAEDGRLEIPNSGRELAEIIRSVLLVRDHEEIEREFLVKSKVAFIKTYIRLSRDLRNAGEGDHELVYTSQIFNVIKHRKYYQTLRAMCNQRGANVANEVVSSLVSDGIAVRSTNQIKLDTEKANNYVESEHQK